MKICVFGAGAVGGHLAARLAHAGHDVSIVARKATVDAVSRRGLQLQSATESVSARVRACEDAYAAGVQDLVLVTVKATAVPLLARHLPPLLGRDTPVVFVVNGIPWWYPYGTTNCPPLEMLDPQGGLANTLGIARVIGSVVFSANEVTEPGVILNRSPGLNTLTLGEPDGSLSPRVTAISEAVAATGFAAPVTQDIRKAVWSKLVATNVALLPLCTLARQPMSILGRNPQILKLAKAIVTEAIAVAAAAGYALDLSVDAIFDERRIHSPHKPSMLQDFENQRPLEIDAVLVAVQRFARAAGVPTPHLDSVTAILSQQAADAGLYPQPEESP